MAGFLLWIIVKKILAQDKFFAIFAREDRFKAQF